jgi:TPP-dependent pyruvate/acetoin dehydrogenase alpha subunit
MFYTSLRGSRGDMKLTGERMVKTYRSMCTIRQFGECVHDKEFTAKQVRGFVHLYSEGGES